MDIFPVLATLLNELIDGSAPEATWVLNPQDPGLLKSLDRLSAREASEVASGGGASIAAHVDHLRYGLSLMNRWSKGEHPFADANYRASWDRLTVTDAEWASRREALRAEVYAWREVVKGPREVTVFEMTGMVASVVHLAYHLGAIRQINRSARGPSARD